MNRFVSGEKEKEEREMKRHLIMDINKLNSVLENPDLEKEFQEVFSFVETITGQKCNLDDLTPENIAIWNQKFDEVLKQLLTQRMVKEEHQFTVET